MSGRAKKIQNKGEAFDYIVRETPNRTLQELADGLGVSRERARQLRKDSGACGAIKNLTQAMYEIRRLRALLDESQTKLVDEMKPEA